MKKTLLVVVFLLVSLVAAGWATPSADGEYQAALKSYYSGKYSDAVRRLKSYTAHRPDPAAYYLMGYALYKLKQFDEADDCFREAYLIDPTFTPVKPGTYDEAAMPKPREKARKAALKASAAAETPAAKDTTMQMSDAKKAESSKPEAPKPAQPVAIAKQAAPEAAKSEKPTAAPATGQAKPAPAPVAPQPAKPATTQQIAPAKPAAAPEAPKPAAQPSTPQPAKPQVQTPQTPAPAPKAVKPIQPTAKEVGGLIAIPMLIGSLFAGFALVFLGIFIAIYIFFSFCLYRIAVRLNCPASWTAWVPLLNLAAVAGSAGKPWWWALLMLIPVAGFFVWVYLWMLIVENLGKNRLLGLLMILPPVNLVFMALLAFSKDKTPEPVITELE